MAAVVRDSRVSPPLTTASNTPVPARQRSSADFPSLGGGTPLDRYTSTCFTSVVKKTVYVPDDLWERAARAAGSQMNDSQIVQTALRRWVELERAPLPFVQQ